MKDQKSDVESGNDKGYRERTRWGAERGRGRLRHREN